MTQKIVVNGTEYDSPDAMPPDVRRQYQRALQLVQDVAKGAAPQGTTERTVATTRDGMSVKVHTKQVKYSVDGKTYDDPSQLPAEVRARVERSEEHTSELQSRLHLVCRLLLEKKKKKHQRQISRKQLTN